MDTKYKSMDGHEWAGVHAKYAEELERAGFDVYAYSGRFMYGAYCPAVNIDDLSELVTLYRSTTIPQGRFRTDSMGLGYVIYVP